MGRRKEVIALFPSDKFDRRLVHSTVDRTRTSGLASPDHVERYIRTYPLLRDRTILRHPGLDILREWKYSKMLVWLNLDQHLNEPNWKFPNQDTVGDAAD